MTIKQVYAILNSVASQLYGRNAISVTNTADFYSLAETVLSSSENMDRFCGALVDRIGKTIVRTLDVSLDFPGMMRNEFEFGAILQKIEIQPLTAQEQKAWNVGDVDFTPDQFKIDKPAVSEKLFRGSAAFEFDLTVPDILFRSAFTSESQMSSFMAGVYKSLATSMTMHINFLTRGVVVGAIAEKIAVNKYVDLLYLYNQGHDDLTAAQALESTDFLKFAGRQIENYISYMEEPSVLFNEGNMIRSTARDNMHVLMNTVFTSAYRVYLESGTFNRSLVELPYFNEVKYWQGSGTNFITDETQTTGLWAKTKNGTDVAISWVIGMLADRQAISTGLTDRFEAADRNNRQRYTNYTSGATLQHAVDLSENIVVFTLGSPVITPPADNSNVSTTKKK